MGTIVNLGSEKIDRIDGKNYKTFVNSTEIYSTLTEIINISGSGYLKTAFIASSPTAKLEIKITIDDYVFLNLMGESVAGNYGIGVIGKKDDLNDPGEDCYPFSAIAISYQPFQLSSNFTINNELQQSVSTSGCIFPIGEYIKFNKNLKIEALKSTASTLLAVEYYLD